MASASTSAATPVATARMAIQVMTLRKRARRAEKGKENDLADGAAVGEQHGEAVDADAFPGRGRQAVGEGADVVFVHLMGFQVAALALAQLVAEAFVLFEGVVDLA